MVGEAARAALRQWCSPLHGQMQWASGGFGLHDGGRDGVVSARLGRASQCSVAKAVSGVWSWSVGGVPPLLEGDAAAVVGLPWRLPL
jgi:hypothetical protein